MNGNFKMRIGGTPTAPASNDTSGGINGTPLLYLPADMVVDPKTNRLYIADGYGNRRILSSMPTPANISAISVPMVPTRWMTPRPPRPGAG